MKKFLQFLLPDKLYLTLLLMLIGVVIFSCRKDREDTSTATALTNLQLSQAKQWYQSNYNSSNTVTNNLIAQSTNATTSSPVSWDYIFSPAWAKAITFFIDSVTYFELPVVKTNGDFAISRKDIGNAKYDFSKSMSRSSIIFT